MNTASEQDALLAAIFANADDDAPRLAYADWLDEHGESEQAAFIRVQIGCANQTDPKALAKLKRRETAAFRALKKKWADLFAGTALFQQQDFTRGFVRGSADVWVALSVEQYIARSNDWWPRLPIREVWLTCSGTVPDRFFDCPHLRRLTAILISNPRHSAGGRQMEVLPEPFVVRLFSCDSFDRLDRMQIGRVPLSRPVVDALCTAPYLSRLNHLSAAYFMSRSAGVIHRGDVTFSTYHMRHTPGTAARVIANKLSGLEDFFVTVPSGETSCAEIVAHTWE